jgi:hypothetical protein
MRSCIEHIHQVVDDITPCLGDGRRDPFIGSEGPDEYLVGTLDFTGIGYTYIPKHLELAEEMLIPPQFCQHIAGTPLESRNMHPPLWDIVYHEYAPVEAFSMTLSTVPLATNPINGPGQGLSKTQYIDVMAHVHGMLFTAGYKPSTFPYYLDNDYPMLHLDDDGNLVTDDTCDPDGAGMEAGYTIRNLYAALQPEYAGEFVLYGRAQRPLQEVRMTADEQQINPAFYCKTVNNQIVAYDLTAFPYFVDPNGWDSMPFNVSKVLHSVWQNQDGVIGILLYNWTDDDVSFEGKFNPELYGLSASDNYTVVQRVQGGNDVVLGTFSDTLTIKFGGNPGGGNELLMNAIPKRSENWDTGANLVVLQIN